MDENYLDQLLKNVEWKEDLPEPEEEPAAEVGAYSDKPVEMEENLNSDAANIRDVAWSDAEIPTEEISELDELDKLADMDMNDMDFADIDFDDVDVTKLDYDELCSPLSPEEIKDLQIDENYLDEKSQDDFEWEFQQMKQEADARLDTKLEEPVSDVDYASASEDEEPDTDIDAMFREVFGEEGPDLEAAEQESEQKEPEQVISTPDSDSTGASEGASADMDDLFAMLGLDANEDMIAPVKATDEIPDFEIPPELADVKDIRDIDEKKEKKRGFMDILFGEDDSDELTPEEEAALEEKKQKKAEARLKRKEENQEKKAAQNEKKKKVQKEKAAKLATRKAEEAKILAAEGPEKKLNKPLCIIIVLFFLLVGGAVVLGTNVFDYTLVITKATGYFERQKYGMAYREILGVDVKEPDKDLESRIYTVMYIERQYEAFENYKNMNKPDYALNALLQGISKYDTYYSEAAALNILEDYNYARNQIVTALDTVYGMSQEEALEILELSDQEYTEQIKLRSVDIQFEEDVTQ